MEISRKSNFRFKALVIGLLATIIASVCGPVVYGFSLLNLKPENEPFLNRTVTFTGPTYWRSDGQGRKISLFRKGETQQIKDSGTYEGVITLIDPNNTYKYYILGKGWIAENQIQTARRFVTLEINPSKEENGLKVNGFLKVDGEYLDIVSDNDAVVSVDKENKAIVARAAGSTTIKIKQKDGDPIELVAVVVGNENKEGGLTLQLGIDEENMAAKLSATLDNATVDVWNKTATLHASGQADAILSIKDGKVTLEAQGNGEADLQFKGKEVARIDAEGTITAVVDPRAMTADVVAESTQKLTILERLTIALKEKGHVEADMNHVEADGEVSGEVNGNEVAAVNGQVSYTKGDTDPKGMAGARIFGKEFSTGEKDIPIVSGLKTLIGQIRK